MKQRKIPDCITRHQLYHQSIDSTEYNAHKTNTFGEEREVLSWFLTVPDPFQDDGVLG